MWTFCSFSFKNMLIYSFPYLILTLPSVLANMKYSVFSTTEVIINRCDRSTKLYEITSDGIMECAKFCGKDSDCKRFMYCDSMSKCTLYLDGTHCITPLQLYSTDCSCHRKDRGCIDNNCICPWGYYGERCQHLIKDCKDGYNKGIRHSNTILTSIQHATKNQPIEVLCLLDYGGLTYFLNRDSSCDVEDFNRTLADYIGGFGAVTANSWLGFDKILQMIKNYPNLEAILELSLTTTNKSTCKVQYRDIKISDVETDYHLTSSASNMVASFTMCPDVFFGQIGMNDTSFSTLDVDFTDHNCPARFGGGWWFANELACTNCFLTGNMDGVVSNVWDTYKSFGTIHAVLKFQ